MQGPLVTSLLVLFFANVGHSLSNSTRSEDVDLAGLQVFKLPPNNDDVTPNLIVRVIVVLTVATIMMISLLGNGFLLRRFVQQKKYRTATNRLIISQCSADLLLSAVAMPLAIASQFTVTARLLPHPLDLVQIFTMRLFMTVSVMNLSAVAVDRLSALDKHESPPKMSQNKAIVLAIIFWSLSIFISLPLEILAEGVDHYKQTLNKDFGLLRLHETENRMKLTAPALRTIILCSASVFVALYCFIKIIVLINRRKSEMASSTLTDSGTIRTVRLRVRSAYTIVIVFGIFMLCTFPFYTIFILTVANITTPTGLVVAAKLLSWSSTASRPFVYITRCKKWQGKRLLSALRNGKVSLDDILSKAKSRHDEMKFFPQPMVDFTGDQSLPTDINANEPAE